MPNGPKRKYIFPRVMECEKVGPRVMECEKIVGPRLMDCEQTKGPRVMECEKTDNGRRTLPSKPRKSRGANRKLKS